MPNLRWLGLVCAWGLGSLAAWAQPPGPMVCTTTTAPPPLVRTEGVAERAGDLILTCTGGTPTPAGQSVPQVNLQVYYNADVPNRLLSTSGFTDVLLVADEAGSPANPNRLVCGTPFTGVCSITGTGTGAGVYNGTSGRPNVFQAQSNGLNSIQWIGVPIDPPGSIAVRTFRMGMSGSMPIRKGPSPIRRKCSPVRCPLSVRTRPPSITRTPCSASSATEWSSPPVPRLRSSSAHRRTPPWRRTRIRTGRRSSR